MKQTLVKLEWDSIFFNFNVGKISGAIENSNDLEDVENLILKNDIFLTYFSVQQVLPAFAFESKKLDFCLVDKKTTYSKNINPNLEINLSISSIDSTTPEKKLIDLAIQSGKYSRFNIDFKVGKEKFEKMYSLLMKNSINKTIAKDVFVYNEQSEIAGFVTMGG
jgi:dTDP-4-amino-4,6-dideoxy-D-galactose acyltransferase